MWWRSSWAGEPMAGNFSPRNVPKAMRSLTSPSTEDRDSTAVRVIT